MAALDGQLTLLSPEDGPTTVQAVNPGRVVIADQSALLREGLTWLMVETGHEVLGLSVLATARTRPGDVASHHAALALQGFPLWQHDRARIDLLTGIRQGVARDGIHLHSRGATSVAARVDGVALGVNSDVTCSPILTSPKGEGTCYW